MQNIPVMECGDGFTRAHNGSIGIVEAKTAAYVVKPEDVGKVFTNRGAGGSVTFTLPVPKAGMRFRFQKAVVNQNIVIVTNTGTVKLHGGVGATQGTTATNSTATEYGACEAYCDGVAWWVANQLGTWAIT